MAKYDAYESQGESSRLFDGGELEYEGDEGSRLPLLLVIGLLVVAAFAGVVWLAYTQGVERGRQDAPRTLVAAQGPVKQAPANPGGSDTPFKGLKIYQQPAPPEDQDLESTPQAPTPAPKVAALKSAEPVTDSDASPAATPSPNTASTNAKPAASGSDESLSVSDSAATRPPKPLASTPPAPAPVVPKPTVVASAALPAPAAAAAPAAPATPDTHAVNGGSAALQIGAYKSEDEANAAWSTFGHKHAMVSAYSSEVKKVDLGDKGIWYRLRIAGFADKSAASTFCDKLKADGGTCFLAR